MDEGLKAECLSIGPHECMNCELQVVISWSNSAHQTIKFEKCILFQHKFAMTCMHAWCCCRVQLNMSISHELMMLITDYYYAVTC